MKDPVKGNFVKGGVKLIALFRRFGEEVVESECCRFIREEEDRTCELRVPRLRRRSRCLRREIDIAA